MSKSILIIDTPDNCYECPCFMEEGWRCQCRMENDEEVHDGRPEWCPLKLTVGVIPIEWIKKYIVDNTQRIDEVAGNTVNYLIYPKQIAKMLTAWWEKENE